ncbi:spore protease YyaC [Planococcus sp. 1R117A]|uniref:spore protease YyaC n=1 Tax=Planococcus sp. 1R117A TaxID=3447020 RepID=UPI003EDC2FD9
MYHIRGKKMLKKEEKVIHRSKLEDLEEESAKLTFELKKIIAQASNDVLFLCIGSDRSTGDSYGPLVGTMLKESLIPYPVYGTLSEPVHALNLQKVLKGIKRNHKNSIVIGIDAGLGDYHQIGSIYLKEGPFKPGKALNKGLHDIGDYHLTAVVNYLDAQFPHHSLNSTRLDTVMNLAKATVKMIVDANHQIKIEELQN